MIAGFKKFILQGNAVDLAVGIVIGIAFKAVVDKIVSAVINPLIGGIFGKPNFDHALTFKVGSHGAVVSVGAVITQLVNFLLVALAVYFLIVMPINALNDRRKRGQEPDDEKSNEEKIVELLQQIAAK
jgi:large conductance mechanosensitive channel